MTVLFGGATVDPSLVGRDREQVRLDEIVASAGDGPRVVLITGEAGIGRTALWRSALARHRAAGHRVLATRPPPEDGGRPLGGLAELLGADPTALDPDLDRFERGRAVLAAIRRRASSGPVVVAVDDLQWLDPPSEGALRYALRRLLDEPVVVVATQRTDAASGLTRAAGGMVPADRREDIPLGPLTLAGTRDVLARAGVTLPRPLVERIHALAGGNPLCALELGRDVAARGDVALTATPPTLGQVFAARLDGLPGPVLAVLRCAAALGPAAADAIGRCAQVPDPGAAVAEGVRRGVLAVGEDLVVRLAHPVLASVVAARTDPAEWRAVHARIAECATDEDLRARHLAPSRSEPDETVAAELDAAARRAARRGAATEAADLARHSVRLTPADDLVARVTRTMAAILHRAAAGDKAGALAECDDLVALMPPGRPRAEAITVRVALDFAGGDSFLSQALAEAGDDDLLRGRVLELQGWLAMTYRGELRRGLALSERAYELAEQLGDPTLEMLAASSVAAGGLLLGEPRPGLMERALDLAARHTGPRVGRWPQGIHGRLCVWCGRLDEARRILEDLHAGFVRSGLEFQRPYRLFDLADLEVAAGNLARAGQLAADGIEAATDAGNPQAAAWLSYPAGLVAAHQGDPARAREAAAVLERSVAGRDGITRRVMASHVLGVAALAAGRPETAIDLMAPGLEVAREAGLRLPSVAAVLPDSIEAAAMVGDAERSAALADELGGDAAAVGQPWVDAAARRGRGLAALAARRAESAGHLGEAAAAFDRLGYRLDAARSLLLQGHALRRAGRRNAAADVLADAHARLDAIGATAWRSHAAAELGRVAPGRQTAELTPTERKVADLVIAGRRNREIAAELFVSLASVEAHLTRIYRKLGVRNRTELGRALE